MRRFVLLFLTLILLLACVLPVSAARADAVQFTDHGEIRNYNAVMLLTDLGLISGYGDGSFRPGNPISRAETAKLIALLCTEEPQDAGIVFADTLTSWAKPYISYCASRGIVGGSAGLFRPVDNVTAQELCKMLLVLLGYGAQDYVGAQWAANVDRDALAYGLYDGFDGPYDMPVTRDGACLLIYNALRSPAVDSIRSDGTVTYKLDALLNPLTYLELRYQAVRYRAVLMANECADLTGETSALEPGVTKLAGHKPFAVSSDLNLLGRMVDVYVRDGQVLGVPCEAADQLYFHMSQPAALKALCQDAGYVFDTGTQYFHNYTAADASALDHASDSARIAILDHDRDQTVDMVLINDCRSLTLTGVSPLCVGSQQVYAFDQGDTFTVGQTVSAVDVAGKTYILS